MAPQHTTIMNQVDATRNNSVKKVQTHVSAQIKDERDQCIRQFKFNNTKPQQQHDSMHKHYAELETTSINYLPQSKNDTGVTAWSYRPTKHQNKCTPNTRQ